MRLKEYTNEEVDYDRARVLRRNATSQEQKLWLALRGEAKKSGIKFRRQHVLHPYIVDFACPKARLVVEIDGYSHDVRHEYDKVREGKLREMGYEVLRFGNDEVDVNIEGVVKVILLAAQSLLVGQKAPTPDPRPRGAGEDCRKRGE